MCACDHSAGSVRLQKEEQSKEGKVLVTPIGLYQGLGLDDWKMALPLGIILAVPALTQDLIILSEETQIVGCFIMFVSAMYTQFGDAIGKSLDEKSHEILRSLNASEDAAMASTRTRIAECESMLSIVDDTKAINALYLETLEKLAKARSAEYKHTMREKYVSMLDLMVTQDANRRSRAHEELVGGAVAYVTEQVQSSKTLKKDALDQAFAALADPSKASAKDSVTDLFTAYLKQATAAARDNMNKEVTLSEEEWKKENDEAKAIWNRFTGPPSGMTEQQYITALKQMGLPLPGPAPEIPRTFVPSKRSSLF